MKKLFIYTYLLLISCSDLPDKVVGSWVQDDVLYSLESSKVDKPMGNLSDAFGEIRLVFKNNFTYKTYFDGKVNEGKWEIGQDLISMTDPNNQNKWNSFKYKLNKDELFIYSDPWLMALRRE